MNISVSDPAGSLPVPDSDFDRELAKRLVEVRAGMEKAGLDVLVCADSGGWFQPSGATRYLTGFAFGPMAGVIEKAAVVVPAQGPPVLVVPQGPRGGIAAWARRTARGAQVRSDPEGGLAGDLMEDIAAVVRESAGPRARVGLSGTFAGWPEALAENLPHAELVDTAVRDGGGSRRDLLERVRARKSPWEVAALVEAQRCAEAGMEAFLAAATPGRRLTEAVAEAHVAAVRAGAEDQLTIMNCGSDPWMWWNAQEQRRFSDHHVLTLETNARYHGYVAQYARATTLGPSSGAQQALLETAHASLTAMVDRLRVGATGDDLYQVATEPIKRAGLQPWGRFGHGTGLSADESLAVAPGDDNVVADGTCLALHASVLDPESNETVLVGEQFVVAKGRVLPLSAHSQHATQQEVEQ
ncbi:M24 family metallopeptidase [Streptomyces sp. NPDC005374]|uniref:M24 family metallopeptidase n=1 Tax=Streptomyces sp. NPDC005374 TaxID=3364713 RepID=UPI0036A89324